MAPCAQLVIGPAGSGKVSRILEPPMTSTSWHFPTQSTFCSNIYQHLSNYGRTVHVINLDPAADDFKYPVSGDVRDLISLSEVMEEMDLLAFEEKNLLSMGGLMVEMEAKVALYS